MLRFSDKVLQSSDKVLQSVEKMWKDSDKVLHKMWMDSDKVLQRLWINSDKVLRLFSFPRGFLVRISLESVLKIFVFFGGKFSENLSGRCFRRGFLCLSVSCAFSFSVRLMVFELLRESFLPVKTLLWINSDKVLQFERLTVTDRRMAGLGIRRAAEPFRSDRRERRNGAEA